MSIVFTKPLSETDIMNSHNNNIVEFNSDSVLIATKCTLDFGSVSFEITPDPEGNFSYNLKHAVKELINSNNFIDQITPDIEADGYKYLDSTLQRIVPLTFTIVFENETTEQTTKNYLFTKSVKQPDQYDRTIIQSAVDEIAILLPYRDYSIKSHAATYFVGYPFDVTVYSNTARTVKIVNNTNLMEYDVSMSKGANRIFLSDGGANFSFEDDLPLVYGENVLQFKVNNVIKSTLVLTKKESGCGRYLKYYSDSGSYQYFLFDDIFTQDEATKIIDNLQGRHQSIEESVGIDRITGKTSGSVLNLFTEYLTTDQMNYLKPIIASPRVELYTRNQFEKQITTSWRSVVLIDGTFRVLNTKKELKRLALQVGYTNHTLSL